MEETLKLELAALLDEAAAALASGDTTTAQAKVEEAKDKLKPLPGQGSTGGVH